MVCVTRLYSILVYGTHLLPLYDSGLPDSGLTPLSPAASARKFSAVRGTVLPYSPTATVPAGSPPMRIFMPICAGDERRRNPTKHHVHDSAKTKFRPRTSRLVSLAWQTSAS